MESILSQQQLTDQLSSRDPFQKAQAMYQQQQGQNQPTPFGAANTPDPMQSAQSPTSTINALYYQPEQAGANPDNGSQFTQMLQAQGIDSQGLQFNDMGRMQLIARLTKKFGDSYMSQPLAKQIMQTFDQSRQTLGQPAKDKQDQSQVAGSRTLAFLQGLQR
jgi:hypothetical protein